MFPNNRTQWLVTALLLGLAAVVYVPARHGLRCRFWASLPVAPKPPVDPLWPGLLRLDFADTRFRWHLGASVDRVIDHRWRPDELSHRSVRWTGWLWAPEEGVYSLGTRSDDGSSVAIDGHLVAVNWQVHAARTHRGRVWLSSGFHRLRVDFYQLGGPAEVTFLWKRPGRPEEPVPAHYLFRARGPEVTPRGRLLASTGFEAWENRVPAPGERISGWAWADRWAGLGEDAVLAAGLGAAPAKPSPGPGASPPGTVRVWRAFLDVSYTSSWELSLASGHRSMVYLDGQPVIGRPGVPAVGPASCARTLAAGLHTVRIVTMDLDRMEPGLRVAPAAPARARPTAGAPREAGASGTPPAQPPPSADLFAAQHLVPSVEVGEEQGGIPILTEVHSQVCFWTETRLQAPCIYSWDSKRQGHPGAVAPLQATWDGELTVPVDGVWTMAVRGSGEALLELGGHRLYKGQDAAGAEMDIPLRAGPTRLSLSIRDPSLVRNVSLLWRPPGGKLGPVPSGNLRPPDASRTASRQLAVAAALLLATGLLLAVGGGPGTYGRFLLRHRTIHAWGLLLLVGLALRLLDYPYVPAAGETEDEFTYHMAGTCLLTGKTPIGWAWMDPFPVARKIPLHGRVFRVVAPMAVYPPVFSLAIGAVNLWAGATSAFETRLYATRLVPIALSLLTLALVWPVARAVRLSDRAGLLATAFLALYPVIVVQARLVKEENLLAPLFLGVIYLVAHYHRSRGPLWRWSMGALVVFSILTKPMGSAATLFAVTALWRRGHWRAGGLLSLFGVLGVLLFMWYGLAVGGEFFASQLTMFTKYSCRLDALFPFVAENRVTGPVLGSGWLVGLLFAFALFTARRGTSHGGGVLATAVVSYTLVLVACHPAQHCWGWYRIPIMPLLAIAWGAETARLITFYEPVRATMWLGLFLLTGLQELAVPTCPGDLWLAPGGAPGYPFGPTGLDFEAQRVVLRVLLVGFALPSLFVPALPVSARRIVSALLAGGLLLTLALCFGLTVVHWETVHPPWVPDDAGGPYENPP